MGDILSTVSRMMAEYEKVSSMVRSAEPDGFPSRSGDPSVSGGAHGDPTFTAVVQRSHHQNRDPIKRVQKDFEVSIYALRRDADALLSRVLVVSASAIDNEGTHSVVWCRSCERVGYSSPSYEKAKVHRLCRWCYDWLREEGELPSTQAVDAHSRGQNIRRPKKKPGPSCA